MIERKTGLLYELLIRGNFDDATRLGQFNGGHLIEADAIVDTDTGQVISYNHGAPVPISEERARKYFGEQFTSFNAGFDTLKANLVKIEASRDEARSELAEVRAKLIKANSDLEKMQSEQAETIKAKAKP